MHALIIGAGYGGIAAALRLRAKGYDVTLIDRCKQLGGRAQVFVRDGFRHDAGPTVITAPFLFEELFALFGEKLSDHLALVPLKPWYRFYFSDGDTFNYGGSLEETLQEIGRIEPNDCAGYLQLLEQSKRIFDVGFTELSAKPFHAFGTMLRQIPRLIGLRSYETVWQLVSRYLTSTKLRRAFSIQPLLVGGNPFDTTSIYGLIHYLERAYGVHFAMGGTGAITKALSDLMLRQGIEVQLNKTVASLDIQNGTVRGVTLEDGRFLSADIVVSNADPAHLYKKMVKPTEQPPMLRLKRANVQFSMGLFVLYFGTTKTYPSVAHHTIWMGERYRELLADIFDHKILSDDFSLYLHRPTATDPSFAPPDCDSFYVLCPVPNLLGRVDWKTEGDRLRDRIVAALGKTILPDLSNTITADFYMTPENFQHDYLSQHGAGFSVSPIFRQSAWFRFHNRAEGIKNLYLVGAGTHPGAGLPGVLCSAKVLDNLIPSVSKLDKLVESDDEKGKAELVNANYVLAKNGRSFYWARHLLGQEHANRATRLYRLCRYIDNLADESQSCILSQEYLSEVAVSFRSGQSKDPIIRDGIALFEECAINPEIFLELVAGVQTDLGQVRFSDMDSLLRYCYQVAGTVGLMMCKVLDTDRKDAYAHAVDLGIAMQLTNICRDIAADALLGRRYLPSSMVGDIDPAELINPAPSVQKIVVPCVAALLQCADQYYVSGENGLPFLPTRARAGILVAARVYHGIGTELRKRNFAYWEGRAIVSPWRKSLISARALAGILSHGMLIQAPQAHNDALHLALQRSNLKSVPFIYDATV